MRKTGLYPACSCSQLAFAGLLRVKLPIPQYDWLCASSHVWQVTLPSLNEESFVTQLTLPRPFARGIFNLSGEREVLAMLALLALLRYHQLMATIVIRNLDPAVKRKLQIRAARNGEGRLSGGSLLTIGAEAAAVAQDSLVALVPVLHALERTITLVCCSQPPASPKRMLHDHDMAHP